MKISPSMSLSSFKRNSFGLSISSLFDKAGREGAYYGDSYDEILRKNNEALGPETINGGWVTSSGGYDNITTETSPNSFTSVAGTSLTRVAARTNITDSVAKLYYCSFKVTRAVTSGSIGAYARGIAVGDPIGGGLSIGSWTGITATGYYNFFFTGVANRPEIDLLFVASVLGQSYDVKDISIKEVADYSKLVLFDDPYGTVPVFHPQQTTRGKGLLLDRSKGLVRGANIISNSGFDSDLTNWLTYSGTSSVVDGQAVVVSDAASGRIEQPRTLVPFQWYVASLKVVSQTTGGVRLSVIRAAAGSYAAIASKATIIGETIRIIFQAPASDAIFQAANSTGSVGTFTVDDFTCVPLAGNHMQQPTAAARGELSARINLVNNSKYSGGGATPANWSRPVATGNSEPLGQTADGSIIYRQSGIAGDRPLFMQSTAAVSVGEIYVLSLRIHAVAANSNLQIRQVIGRAGVSTAVEQFFVNGVEVPNNTLITEACVISAKYTFTGAGSNEIRTGPGCIGGQPTSFSIDFSSPDYRLAADAISSIPSYQAVRSATDYDTAGFPVYWRAQTDDWAKARINPNGATKAMVMWAGQKIGDAVVGVVFESSINSSITDGTLGMLYPSVVSSNNANVRSRGGIVQNANGSTSPAGTRDVLLGVADILTDVISIIINGVTTSTNTGDQGTGIGGSAYVEHDVYFSARAGTTLFGNFREYSPPLIIFMQTADPGLSTAQIKLLQRKYAKAAGVTL